MLDIFNPVHAVDSGVLPVLHQGDLPTANVSGNDIKDPPPKMGLLRLEFASVVAQNDLPTPPNLMPTLYLDVVGPDSPPRPK